MNYDPSIYDGTQTVLQQLEALKKQYKVAVDTINTFPTVEQLEPKIEGSETVAVDVNEAGTALEIHLDAEVVSDISRSLKTPIANPSEKVLVAIDTNGAQENIPVSQIGGDTFYRHYLVIATTTFSHVTSFHPLTKRGTQYTSPDLHNDAGALIGVFVKTQNQSDSTEKFGYIVGVPLATSGNSKLVISYFDGSTSEYEYSTILTDVIHDF